MIAGMIVKYLESFFNVLFPKLCPVCRNRIDDREELVCLNCLLSLPLYANSNFKENDIIRRLVGTCHIEKATSAFYYFHGSELHRIVEKFKYGGDSKLAVFMGQVAADIIAGKGFFDGIDCMVPIPLHPSRFRQRGYNQAAKISEGISLKTGLPVLNILERKKDNKSQTTLSAVQRISNVSGIFELKNPELCRNKHVLLIDDIITTGATLMEAASVLSDVAENVSILALASTNG